MDISELSETQLEASAYRHLVVVLAGETARRNLEVIEARLVEVRDAKPPTSLEPETTDDVG